MKSRTVPATGIAVSPVTLGTMTYGSPVAFNDAVELTRYAVERGINLIDTANMYEGYNRNAGSPGGIAEEIVGQALVGFHGQALVATKLGMKVGDTPEDEGTSAAAIRKQLPASLKRLQTDTIDIYYLHKPGPPEQLPDTLCELAYAVKEKAIRCYGVSNYSVAELQLLLDTAAKLGLPKPAICQPALSLLKQEPLAALFPLCAQQGIAISPYQIYQGGLLTGKYRYGTPPPDGSRAAEKPEWLWQLDDSLYQTLDEIEQQAAAKNMSMAEYALCWVLNQPAVVSAIVGVKNRAQVDAAIAAAARCC